MTITAMIKGMTKKYLENKLGGIYLSALKWKASKLTLLFRRAEKLIRGIGPHCEIIFPLSLIHTEGREEGVV